MTPPELPRLDSAAHELRARWRDATLEHAWLRIGDWYHPAVDALSECLSEGRPAGAAAQRLGEARGAAGVGVGEAIDDVLCAFATLGREPDPQVLRAVSVGWAEGTAAPAAAAETMDACTGLPTAAYLAVRLRETYGVAAAEGTSVATTHALVVLDVLVDGADRFERLARAVAVGEAMDCVFGTAIPTAVLVHGVYAALVPRDAELPSRLARLRAAVDQASTDHGLLAVLRRPPRVWIQPLPASADGIDELLRSLQP